MVSPGTSALLKTVLIPPLSALALYILFTYLILPHYHRYRERRSYSLVPNGILPEAIAGRAEASAAATNAITSVVTALSGVILRAAGGTDYNRRRGSEEEEGSMRDFGIGDEELEEGVGMGGGIAGRTGRVLGVNGGEVRLSRELEGGFMSDSSDEDG